MTLAKLQYISQGDTMQAQIKNIQQALEAGCTWVQLRFKNANENEFMKVAERAKELCSAYNTVFIVNDHVIAAKKIDAHGIHLGLDDMPVLEARAILGGNKIIGGTANTLTHVLQRVEERCDYIGLGPFRFTRTKEKLSPVLGLRGYECIMQKLSKREISIPIYAIGGILKDDIDDILRTGIYGVAVSGAITNERASNAWIQNLKSIYEESSHCR
jgi:thiamine-phosphate pyrophosphorylase